MASPQSPAVNSTDVPSSTPPHPAGMQPPAKCRSGEEGHCLAQLQCTQQAGDRLADLAAGLNTNLAFFLFALKNTI